MIFRKITRPFRGIWAVMLIAALAGALAAADDVLEVTGAGHTVVRGVDPGAVSAGQVAIGGGHVRAQAMTVDGQAVVLDNDPRLSAGGGAGGVLTDWQAFTPVFTSNSAITLTFQQNHSFWRRVGSNMEINIWFICGSGTTGGSGLYHLHLPGGGQYLIDGNRIRIGTNAGGVDTMPAVCGSGWAGDNVTFNYPLHVHPKSITSLGARQPWPGTLSWRYWAADGAGLSPGRCFSFQASVPIQGW